MGSSISLHATPIRCKAVPCPPASIESSPPSLAPHVCDHWTQGRSLYRQESRPCSCISMNRFEADQLYATYVNPLIKVNSCLISPPCSFAVSFALHRVSTDGEPGRVSNVLGEFSRGGVLFEGNLEHRRQLAPYEDMARQGWNLTYVVQHPDR